MTRRTILFCWLALLGSGAGYFFLSKESRQGELPKGQEEQRSLYLVATTGMIGDALRQIAGEKAQVVVLMGPGVDPHSYEPVLSDLEAMQRADLLFYNGLHLEGTMEETFHKMRRTQKLYAVSDALAQEEIIRDPDFSAGTDPHFWHSVPLFIKAVELMIEALATQDPERARDYQARGQAYIQRLEALDQWIKTQIAALKKAIAPREAILITSHDAFSYLGVAYELRVKGLQGISTVEAVGFKDIELMHQFIRAHHVHTLFAETSVNPKGIEALMANAVREGYDLAVGPPLFSDAIGAADTPEGSYEGMMRANITRIIQGLRRKEDESTR